MGSDPVKIVVANDEQGALVCMSERLLKEGYIVFQATTKEACIASIENYKPDIVILDDQFADGNGADMCRELKSDERTKAMYVILCSPSETDEKNILYQLSCRADDYFTKAAQPWEILASIRAFLKTKEIRFNLLEKQQYYASLFDYHPDAVYSFDLEGNFTSVNSACTKLCGYSKEELLSMSFIPLIAPDQLSKCMEYFEKVLEGETHYYNAALIHKDGRRIEINITGIPIIVNDKFIGIHGISKDITTAVRMEKIAVAENKVLELALTGCTLDATLSFLIKSIEDISHDMMSSVMLLDEDGKTLRSRPAPSLPKTYTDYIDRLTIGPDAGSCGTSVYLKQAVFVSDIALDKRWKNHKHIALEHGLKACFSFPIFSASKEVLGTFGCYYKQVHLPDSNDIQLIERAVNIAGILIERDKSQKQIHRKEEQLQQISNSVPGAIYQFQLKKDGSINFPYFSPTIKELYNVSPEEIYHNPQNILKKIHPEDLDTFYQSIQTSAHTMQPWLLDYRLLASDNEERDIIWVRGHSIPRIQEDGSIIWHGMITDITDIKKTEETLRMLRRAVESAAEGILVTDASEDNIVIFANEKFFKDTGYTREEVMGHNCRFLQGKDTDPNTVNRIREAIAEQKLFIGEIYNYKKDGTPFWNMLVVAPVLNDDGHVSHFVGLINDITERKEAERKLLEQNNQLRKINQELDRFVYSVSHDLRAPLTSVLGLIELTYERIADQQAKQYLQLMEESIVKLDTTIKDILDYSRNTRTETLIEQVNLRSLIDEVFTGLHCMQNADLVEKYIEINEAAPCFSDRKRLLLILHNILSNAIKYHNPLITNPFIHIQVQVTLDEVSIVIHDNGIGIPEKHIDKIFDMFFRASKLSTGTGLGLYIVKETVAKLNGNIKVDSCPDHGSTFTITLPNYAQVN